MADADSTAAKLARAATAEFAEHGFAGTDSNRIARRAGFAPQTFYRWFRDKTEIFIAVYRAWEDQEKALIQDLLARQAGDDDLVEACVAHHRAHLRFRHSLRQLSLEDDAVRRARADSRLRQIAQIRLWSQAPDRDAAGIATALLQIERLSDALAEGEFADLGLAEGPARRALAGILGNLRRP